LANALVDLAPANLVVGGRIKVLAGASGNVSGEARAVANLALRAVTGDATLDGAVSVQAQANDFGAPKGSAAASALMGVTAARNLTVLNNVDVGATASTHVFSHGVAGAQAVLSANAGNSAVFHNAVSVLALESGDRANTGSAVAKADIQTDTGDI